MKDDFDLQWLEGFSEGINWAILKMRKKVEEDKK